MTKDGIRRRIWDLMGAERVARFPGAHGRIPNFTGAPEAAARLAETEVWRRAKVLKCNPDAPQLPVRFRALQEEKKVCMAVPRLREADCFILLDPERLLRKRLREAASIGGAFRYGKPVHPRNMPSVDLVIAGSVAVNRRGQRIGKGGGYSDLEWALGREFGFLTAGTRVATTVHSLQVLREPLPVLPHDLTVNFIVTPDETIFVKPVPRKPGGVDPALVTDEMLASIPILQEIL